MSLLSRHLEQISLSSESIATLPFPPPKIFTNALLSTTDITTLIRDTEPHERALFSVPPPPPPPAGPSASASSSSFNNPASNAATSASASTRRQTVFSVAAGEVTTANPSASSASSARVPRKNTAVAAVLGPELHHAVRRSEGRGDLDVEVLLRGVEQLNAVFETRGVNERVAAIRARHGRLTESIAGYEGKVQRLTRELDGLSRGGDDWDEELEAQGEGEGGDEVEVTDEDLRREEEEIRDLERKKRELEERVSGMERDLGGLLR